MPVRSATFVAAFAATAAVASAANFGTSDAFTARAADTATLEGTYPLETPGGIQGLNPFLTSAEAISDASVTGAQCGASNLLHATCADTPALASGMTLGQVDANGDYIFYAISDRGPNQDCGDMYADRGDTSKVKSGFSSTVDSGKGFPVKEFSPTMATIKLDKATGKATMTNTCYLKKTDGNPATGLPTHALDDTPYGAWCEGSQLAYDQAGFDAEDIQPIPGTDYSVIVDEYSPAIAVINTKWSDATNCGKILARYVPESFESSYNTATAGIPIKKVLPGSYDQRRKNRGFEGVAISPDGKTVAAFMQSALQVKNQTYFDLHNGGVDFDTRDAEFTVVLFMDFTNPLDATVLGTKLYPLDHWNTWPSNSGPSKYDKTKISGALWLGTEYGVNDNKQVIAVLERHDSVRIHIVDFEVATLISESQHSAAKLTIQNTTDNIKALGINLARKQELVDTADIATWTSAGHGAKIEGFSIVNDYTLVLANDNDFGLENNLATKIAVVKTAKSVSGLANQLLATPPPSAPAPPPSPSAAVRNNGLLISVIVAAAGYTLIA